jgi:hypothetical protein
MPALVAGIHAFLSSGKQGVDGRDKPGHDDLSFVVMAISLKGARSFDCHARACPGSHEAL